MFRMYPNYFKDNCQLNYITQSFKKTLIKISQLEQEKKSTMFKHLLITIVKSINFYIVMSFITIVI